MAFLYNTFIDDVLRFGELHVVFVSISQVLFMVVIKYYYLCNMFVTMATKGQTQTLLSVENHYAITTLYPFLLPSTWDKLEMLLVNLPTIKNSKLITSVQWCVLILGKTAQGQVENRNSFCSYVTKPHCSIFW